MDDPTQTVHRIAAGDHGFVPVVVVEDLGDLKVLYQAPGFRVFFPIRRQDFVPAPAVAP